MTSRNVYMIALAFLLMASCNKSADKESIKKEILKAEQEFKKMAAEKGIAEAFVFYADENAVIKRANDSLVIGRESIKKYYENQKTSNATVEWAPDFIDVSDDGTMGYTYGKYIWTITDSTGSKEFKGIFHTVWKKQKNGEWRYVWD